MTLAALLPMAALGAFGIVQVVLEYQGAYRERLLATARLQSLALDSEIRMRTVAIMALAASPLLDDPGSRVLYDYASRIGDGLDGWVRIDTPDGPILNTRIPYGATQPSAARPWSTGRNAHFQVTDVLTAQGVASPFVSVTGPVFRNGQLAATICIPFANQHLSRRLAEGLVTGDGTLFLMDANGAVIARARDEAHVHVGSVVPAWLRAAAAGAGPAVTTGELKDDGAVVTATAHPSEAPAWTVVVARPIRSYYAAWFRPLLVLGGGGLLVVLAVLLLVDRLALWLVRPLQALTQNARIVARGRREGLSEARYTSRVKEFEALRVSLNDAAQVMDGRAEAIRVAFASARRERNLLHSVVNGTADPTYVTDTAGRLALANAAGLAVLGVPAAKALGQVLCEPGAAATDTAPHAEDAQVIASGMPVTVERVLEIDGERRNFVGAKSPWRSASGEVLGVVMIIHDITGWKRSETRLREIQGELIRTGRLSAMGAMASGLAHELNQPLSAITNYLGATRRLMARAASLPGTGKADASGLLATANGAIDEACAQALRAGEIVNRLREFIGGGVAAMRAETIDDLISEACALALPQDTRASVSLRVSLDPDLDSVFVDRLQIEQVLVNVMLNAVQSVAGSAQRRIAITARRDAGGDTCIEVADTGPGIPEPLLPSVFEPFVSSRPDGLGMGLAIARMIMAAHGGTLAARNNSDGGATLTLTLPAVLSMESADA